MKCYQCTPVLLFVLYAQFLSNVYCQFIKLHLSKTYCVDFCLSNSYIYSLFLDLQLTTIGLDSSVGNYLQPINTISFPHRIYYHSKCHLTSVYQHTLTFGAYFRNEGNVLGLGRQLNPHEYNYSIIHALHDQHIIDSNVFALELSSNDNKHFLYLGNVPSNETSKYTTKSTFTVNQAPPSVYNSTWSIYADGLRYQNKYHNNFNKTIIFTLNGESMIISKDVHEWFVSNIFDLFIKDKKCAVEQQINWYFYVCDADVYDKLSPIQFIQGKTVFEYTIRDDGSGKADIAYNPYLDLTNHSIYLRVGAFREKVVTFDLDKQVIEVYSNTSLGKVNVKGSISNVSIVVCIVGIFGLMNNICLYIFKLNGSYIYY